MFFFSLHLKCGRRRGKGLFFLLNFFFIMKCLRKGKVFFLQIHYGGKGWLKVVICKILNTCEFEFISVFLIHSFRMSSTPST